MIQIPPPPLRTPIEAKVASPEWQRWFSLLPIQLRAGVSGSGTANNVTMFTGPNSIGNAPGFTYSPSEGGIYNFANLVNVAGTLSANEISVTTDITAGSMVVIGALTAGSYSSTSLSGTGTRLVTSTAGGTLGNATTIAGAYTFSGALAASNLSGTNTGDQTITLTGDVTGSGTGSFAATIGANTVTLAKMAQVATGIMLGRLTAGTGNVEALTGSQVRTNIGLSSSDAVSFSSITLSLAANRVPYTNGGGTLIVASTLTYDGTTLAVNNGTYSGTLTVTGAGRFNGSLGIGIAPGASLDVVGSNSTTSRAAVFRTGLTTGGAAADYLDVIFRHVNSVGGYIDGASIRSTVVNPANGVRTSKLGLYGSNNEVQTLGLEIGATGTGAFSSTLSVAGEATLSAAMTNNITNVSTDITLSATQHTVYVYAGSANRIITLPLASTCTGRVYIIRKSDGSANTVTVTVQGADSIEDVFSVVLGGTSALGRLVVRSGGGNYWAIEELYDEGFFTGTLTGVSPSVTGTIRWVRNGRQVTMMLPQILGNSNSTSCTITGASSVIWPKRIIAFPGVMVIDNSASVFGAGSGLRISTAGVITLYTNSTTTGFTAAGVKGFFADVDGAGSTATQPFSYTLL